MDPDAQLTVHLTVRGGTAEVVDPRAAEIVQATLTVPGRCYDPAAIRWRERPDQLCSTRQERWRCEVGDDTSWSFPRGLLPRVKQALEQAGYRVKIETLRGAALKRPELDPRVVATLPPELVNAVVAAAAGSGALVGLASGWKAKDVASRLIAAFPRARVLLPVSNRDEVATWRSYLERRVGRPVGDQRIRCQVTPRDPLVCVACEPHSEWASSEQFHLVIHPQAERILRSRTRFGPVEDEGIPTLGLLPRGYRLDQYERLRAEGLFSADDGIHQLPHRGPRAGVTTLVVQERPGGTVGDWRPRLRHHACRNRLVAEVAWAYQQGEAATLARRGLPPLESPAPAVAVLVEEVQHATQFAGLLPGWTILDGQAPPAPAGPITRAIITDGWRTLRRSTAFDVLIDARAADPVSPLPIDRATGLLVDVQDRWDPDLDRRHRQRLTYYRQIGLQAVHLTEEALLPPR